nr:hypothetical protein CFP56_51536 [Quercus suber]
MKFCHSQAKAKERIMERRRRNRLKTRLAWVEAVIVVCKLVLISGNKASPCSSIILHIFYHMMHKSYFWADSRINRRPSFITFNQYEILGCYN